MTERTTCLIAGGGPAGMFLGFLLARAGVSVTVIEKHADFLRDFRGDTIHPSTMQNLHELGLLDEFLPLMDFRANKLKVNINGQTFDGPDFSDLDTKCPFMGFVPQWDLLNFMAEKAAQYPGFDLRMSTKAVDVIRDGGRVRGLRCESDEETYDIHADLVVACDGRGSTIRQCTDHAVDEVGIPIDALWFQLARPEGDRGHTLGWLKNGNMLITIPRRDHYQIAMVIRKGGFDSIRAMGLEAFRGTVASVCPVLKDVTGSLSDWNDVKLLSVQINHMRTWYEPGLLFIGDSAHAMSPVGGVGINLAIQDAVAAANLLSKPLLAGKLTEAELASVQNRRSPPTQRMQRLQRLAHHQLFGRSQNDGQPFSPPWYLKWVLPIAAPFLRRKASRWIGLGFCQEHIQTSPAVPNATSSV
ncbi:FAD-dependent oxidoreductase [Rhodopirellula bahusiensis]|uniref:FAD-binding domain-containing protein n=1 Tax=Rhodopirellula bahusiensis TaxID=2014065 RepID=A0A2G1W2E7_9BACT|nr:FAD-dependent oxidoreductase [Rhodopirellula bahusiensis]PHQ33193.1 hypothetical protein CEE69_22310 [Rhodopirellula bahusiensis]